MTNLPVKLALVILTCSRVFVGNIAIAHDPIFSPGPHVLFKDGVELHLKNENSNNGRQADNKQSLAAKYGLTGDWVVGLTLPYQPVNDPQLSGKAIGDITVSTKYRFWRDDLPGVQESAAVLVNLKLDTAGAKSGTRTNDSIVGLAYGYESLDWYRWASFRYRFNHLETVGQLTRGDRWFADLALGYRFQVNDYRAPDTVWLLEVNGEFIDRSRINGVDVLASGGEQWFVSPGIMWTLRNIAIKAGMQIPIVSGLNGNQRKADERVSIEFEWHI